MTGILERLNRQNGRVVFVIDYFFALLDWCKVQILLLKKDKPMLFKEGEVWWCSIGLNVGVEIYGKGGDFTRPVLIMKKLNAYSFLAVPLTTQPKEGSWYIPIVHGGKERRAALAQIRVLDARRLTIRIGTVNYAEFQKVRGAFLALYG